MTGDLLAVDLILTPGMRDAATSEQRQDENDRVAKLFDQLSKQEGYTELVKFAVHNINALTFELESSADTSDGAVRATKIAGQIWGLRRIFSHIATVKENRDKHLKRMEKEREAVD